jgi:hypothetical protein
MKGKKLMVVGDSLMRQMFNSLRFMLQSSVNDPSSIRFDTRSETIRIDAEDLEISFHWSTHLIETRLFIQNKTLVPSKAWVQRLAQDPRVNILIFNVGHHWHKVDRRFDYYVDMTEVVSLMTSVLTFR